MITLICKLGTEDTQIVEVDIEDPLYTLKKKLDINNNNTKFIFNGVTYMLDSNLTFKDIGLISNSSIFLNTPAISGLIKIDTFKLNINLN